VAGSTDRRNTFCELLSWGLKEQGLSWPFIEPPGDRAELGLAGWEVIDFYEDAGISGSNGQEKRPGLDRLLKDATARKINMIAAWSVDRLGRSLQHLVGFLNELEALGCHLYLHQQAQ
jgi:DNA invertase Pin-like site-specific DNA recombinase